MAPTPKRGGRRPGSGRKPLPIYRQKKMFSTRLDRAVYEAIRNRAAYLGISQAVLLESVDWGQAGPPKRKKVG